MKSRKEVQEEYDIIYQTNPDKWKSLDRSNFMLTVMNAFIPNPKTVLDVGCAPGVTLMNYRRHKSRPKLYGIDPSIEGLRLSKNKVPSGIFTTASEFEDIKKFDLVLCLGVAEHVEDLVPFLKDLKNKISDDGYCYFEVPHNLIYSQGPHTYRRLETRSRQWEWHLTLKEWEALLVNSGFEIVKSLRGLNATWEFIWVLK